MSWRYYVKSYFFFLGWSYIVARDDSHGEYGLLIFATMFLLCYGLYGWYVMVYEVEREAQRIVNEIHRQRRQSALQRLQAEVKHG